MQECLQNIEPMQDRTSKKDLYCFKKIKDLKTLILII